jgi:uncharacterized protein (DUF3820 family)
MATLEEMRRWLQGESIEGLPERTQDAKRGSLDIDKMERMRKSKTNGRWRSILGGMDAVLLFGKFKGCRVSELIKKPDGFSYLEWMSSENFPRELQRIVNLHMRGKR